MAMHVYMNKISSGALTTGSRQKTGIEHQHSRTHIMKAIRDIEMKPILLFLWTL